MYVRKLFFPNLIFCYECFQVSYLGVDTLMTRYPPLVKDKYFDDTNLILPYTGAAFAYKKKTYRGSVHNMQ